MKILLKAIQFENYKNIKNDQILNFSDITTLVGANESGKTNILQSIQCLDKSLDSGDTKIGTPHQPAVLKFLLEIKDDEFKRFLSDSIKNFSEKDLIYLERQGDNKNVLLSGNNFRTKVIRVNTKWKNASTEIIDIDGIELKPDQELYSKEIKKTTLMKFAKSGQLQKIEEDIVLQEIKDKILKSLPEVESWDYRGGEEDEAKYYIPNSVPWKQFIDNPDINFPMKNLFLIAERESKKLAGFQQKLKDLRNNGTEIQNFLIKVSKTINNLIKKVWSQSILELKLTYEGNNLRIDTYEGNELKPPSVRSEGMKWFLSFLIEFHSRGELEEKIILFDQPGERLHPGGQKELRARLGELIPKNQIIYATQEPFLIDRNNWRGVRFFKKTNGETSISLPSKEDIENDELLRCSLGFTLADVGQANEFNIVTEGFTDSFILLEWGRYFNEENIRQNEEPLVDLNKIAIFDRHGCRSIRKRVTELKSSKLIAIGLFDADKEGLSALVDAKRNKILSNHFISLQDCLGKTSKIKTGEDLVPRNIFKDACKIVFSCVNDKDLKKMSNSPRWENICSVAGLNNSDRKEVKDKLWEAIIKDTKNKKLQMDIKEAILARKILESCRKLLEDINNQP